MEYKLEVLVNDIVVAKASAPTEEMLLEKLRGIDASIDRWKKSEEENLSVCCLEPKTIDGAYCRGCGENV